MSFDPKEMLRAQRAKMLWCVHVLGPAEVDAYGRDPIAAIQHVEDRLRDSLQRMAQAHEDKGFV